jgi:adenosylcobinamide-phosphate synthase
MVWPFSDPGVLLVAAVLDLAFGDPPNRIHPVAWMGRLIQSLRRLAPTTGRVGPFLAGILILTVGLTLTGSIGLLVVWLRGSWPVAGLAMEVLIMKAMFSARDLLRAATLVQRSLVAGHLDDARRLVSWHLVSRDTSTLNESGVVAATIESVAENLSDSVVAPWLFYLLGGLPAVMAFRFANTADAMLGYRDPEREWLGKAPARFDDLLSIIPARVTAVLLLLTAPIVGGTIRGGLRIWWRDARLTASPNAGQPMAVAAGALGVELEKIDHYRLGAGLRLPVTSDIARVVRLARVVVGVMLLSLVALLGGRAWA